MNPPGGTFYTAAGREALRGLECRFGGHRGGSGGGCPGCWARLAVVSRAAPSIVTGVCDVQDSKISFLSRSGLARLNSCILGALLLLTAPSTSPEL